MNYYETLVSALATARDAAEETGNADLIALTEMALCDAHYFIARQTREDSKAADLARPGLI